MGNPVLIAKEEDIIEVDADTFYQEFSKRKESIEHTERVLLRSLEHYRNNCKCFFMLKDYSAGVAIEHDGRIISVFSTGVYKHVSAILINKAIQNGGIKLECNDVEQLRYVYTKNGFVPVSKGDLDKNDVYWDILKAQGDNGIVIVFWIYKPLLKDLPDCSINKIVIQDVNIKSFPNEEEAENFRDRILDQVDNLPPELLDYLKTVIIIKE